MPKSINQHRSNSNLNARVQNLPQPLLPVQPLLDAIQIRHEPRAKFGRYFIRAEHELRQRGFTTGIISGETLLQINDQNRNSWSKIISVIDCSVNCIDAFDIICIAIFDATGRPIATIAARRMDICSTLKTDMETLSFFYGQDGAEQKMQSDNFTISAPSAATMTGSIVYLGGLWVHPDFRSDGLAICLARIARNAAFARWAPDFEIVIVTHAFNRPQAIEGHAFEQLEPAFEYIIDGKKAWEGSFAWSSQAYCLAKLDRDLAARDSDLTFDDRRRQHVLHSA
ncbi:MAG: hypothetical protein ABL898_05775 [Hyphomicrobiaceae bacterium]